MNIKELKPLLEEIVGVENVSDDPISLVVYSRDTVLCLHRRQTL